jgi:acyl carrier protein
MSPDAGQRLAQFIQAEVSKDPRQGVLPGTALISSGLVDSFSLIKVLAFIEDEFGIVIPDEAATAKAMDSIELILELMDTYASDGHDA